MPGTNRYALQRIQLARQLTVGARHLPLGTVTMGIGHFEWMCQTGTGTIIEPEMMLPYLSRAEIERMIFDPPNRKLEASTKTMFTGVMRKIIGLRDRHCQHPSGCDQPAHRCDVDHIEPRSCGGITCLCNGQLLCVFHNRIVKAEHDRRLALQHKTEREAEREAERHQTGCLLARPEPCRYCTDLNDDTDLPPARIPDPDNPNSWIRIDEFRRRHTAA